VKAYRSHQELLEGERKKADGIWSEGLRCGGVARRKSETVRHRISLARQGRKRKSLSRAKMGARGRRILIGRKVNGV